MSVYPYSTNPWQSRISNANKKYEEWEARFECSKLEEYYEGFQWRGRANQPSYRPYTLNLVTSTIEIKLANFLFQRPLFTVTPEPGHSHYNLDFAVRSAQLKQDTLNTIIKNKNLKFTRHLKMAALDSFFRFGMIEVGYAADWRNPQKEDPQLRSWLDPDVQEDKDRVVSEDELPINEYFYVKRVKPSQFRVAVCDAEDLEDHEWVGYCQYYYTSTLKKTPGIKFPKEATSTYVSSDYGGASAIFSQDEQSRLFLPHRGGGISKVWHIWDLIAKKRRMLLEDYQFEELWSDDFEKLPFIDLRWNLRLNGYYPIPSVWYWLSPQDEINEAREQVRSYRRRFTRKFQCVKNTVDEEEKEKFVSGPDGVLIEVKQADAISPIQNPEIGATAENALLQAKDDFNLVSGTSAEARGQNVDRETATQAKLVDARAQIRESAQQIDFSEFVCLVGRQILTEAQQKLVTGLWVKMTTDPSEGPMQDMQINAPVYEYVKAQDLSDGYDFTIDIDVQNATPAMQQQMLQAYVGFVTFLAQNPMVAMSPILIRETAYRFGYKNEQVIQQLQQVAVLSMAAKVQQEAGQQGMSLEQAGQQTLQDQQAIQNKQMQVPGDDAITNQINQQLQ